MDAYRLGGGREVEKLILDQFSVFMYNEGRGKEITRTEYLKWKLRGKTRDEVGQGQGWRAIGLAEAGGVCIISSYVICFVWRVM